MGRTHAHTGFEFVEAQRVLAGDADQRGVVRAEAALVQPVAFRLHLKRCERQSVQQQARYQTHLDGLLGCTPNEEPIDELPVRRT
jgi:hypothetical protein